MFDFEYQIKMLPDKPGVYLMKNALGEVIYVGKAKVLKNRVKQYFRSDKNHTDKVRAMVSNVAEFEYIVTDSEMEALILECNLIKKYHPKFNVLLKDDKYYPFIKITVNEDYPRVFMTRSFARDGSRYFGPYTDAGAVYEILDLIKKLFSIRSCRKNIIPEKYEKRPCLNYQIGLCSAPCCGYISKEKYAKMIKEITDVLEGKNRDVINKIKALMEKAAEDLEFESAAALRDKIYAIQKISEKQKIITGNFENEDYIALYSDDKDYSVQIFFVRDGKLLGREHFLLEDTSGMPKSEVTAQFIQQFYGGTAFIPHIIYVQDVSDKELLEQYLSMRKTSRVEIKIPLKGEKKKFIDMVEKNAKMMLEQFKLKILSDKEMHKKELIELTDMLMLDAAPGRIESYDISNIQGVDSVGSMIVFEEGKAKNSDYRRFKIKSVNGANDYESMKEILTRRFEHSISEMQDIKSGKIKYSAGKFCFLPDLIMMDGGKIQVNAALEVLSKYNIDIPVCGMVKDDRHKTRGIIYNNQELSFKNAQNAMKLTARIQDEVHRFAITYHRSLRDKRVLHSILEDVPNVGAKRRIELLKKFGSIENIKNASEAELLSTKGINKIAAESITDFFKNRNK